MNILDFNHFTFLEVVKQINGSIKESFKRDGVILNILKVLLMLNPIFTGIYYIYAGVFVIWILSLALKIFKTPIDIALKLVKYVNNEINDLDKVSKFLINIFTYSFMSYVLILGLTGLVILSCIVFLISWVFNLVLVIDLFIAKRTIVLDVNYNM